MRKVILSCPLCGAMFAVYIVVLFFMFSDFAMRNRSKLWIGAAFAVAGLMLGRFAFAIINDPISPFIIIVSALLFLGGMLYFAKNFRE